MAKLRRLRALIATKNECQTWLEYFRWLQIENVVEGRFGDGNRKRRSEHGKKHLKLLGNGLAQIFYFPSGASAMKLKLAQWRSKFSITSLCTENASFFLSIYYITMSTCDSFLLAISLSEKPSTLAIVIRSLAP